MKAKMNSKWNKKEKLTDDSDQGHPTRIQFKTT